MNERVIFDAALEIADPQARRVFIEKACAGNSGLLAAVEALLKSHDAAGSFLKVPVAEQMLPVPASGKDSPDSGKPSEVFDKTRQFQGRTPDEDDSDDESQPDLSFLQPSSKPGSIGLLGHYEILQVLGQGGFGIVLKAFDEKLHRLVAVKVMNPQMAASSPPRKRFLREARAAAAIRHENVVQVYSVEEQPLPYLVMEFIDGQTLQQKQKDHGPLEVAELLHIGRQVASGLAAAQAMGLIHRDIKPGNILIEQGAEQKVKITDFGLARAADDASLTRSGTISGTPMYMAPEQVLGQALDHRADLFSLGSVLYELATGRPPFRATNTIAVLRRVTEDTPRPMQEIIPEIPDWLVAIVTKLHAKNPDDRFQSAKDVADLLARCQSELQLTGTVTCVNEVSGGRGTPDDARRGSPDPAETLDRRSPLRDESQAQGDLRFPAREVRPGDATPTPAQPKRRFRVSHLLIAGVAGLVVILAGTQLGRIANPYVQKWLWPPIPKLAVTEVATGLRFDGKDDFVKVGPIDLSSPQYTLEAFVTSAKDGDNGVIALLNNVEKEPELMYLYDGYPGKERKSGAGIVGQRPYQSVNAPLPSGTREHRALVVDGQVMHYFVNGIWQGKRYCTARKGLMWEMRELHLGCMANQTQFFRGQIDQLRLSKIARYNNNFTVASKLTSDDSTLALYNFDEAQGDVLNDSSGHGHHGKIVGATWASPSSSSNSLSPVESIDSTNPDRRAAEWVLSIDSGITIRENGLERQISIANELPPNPFELTVAGLQQNIKVSDEGLKAFENCRNITVLYLSDTAVSDAGLAFFKHCHNLTHLDLYRCPVSDAGLAHFQGCKNLVHLNLSKTKVSDDGLAIFQDCAKLKVLSLDSTPVSDARLARFKGFKELTQLYLSNTKVSDSGLAHFKDCQNLELLRLDNTQVTDAGLAHCRDCKALTLVDLRGTKVTPMAVEGLKKVLPACKIEWAGNAIEPQSLTTDKLWEQQVAKLPAAEQLKAVAEKLKERNPGFDGKFKHVHEEFGDVLILNLWAMNLIDLSPVRGLPKLQELICAGQEQQKSKLKDLSPLAGLPIRRLNVSFTAVEDLSPLRQLPLTELDLGGTKVSDLASLRDLKLKRLNLYSCPVTSVIELRGMPLEELFLLRTRVRDLTPLQECPLKNLNLDFCNITDLRPLQGLSLDRLSLAYTPVSDLRPLKGQPLQWFNFENSKVRDLTPLEGMPLTFLWANGSTSISDTTPLKGMPLEHVRVNFLAGRDAEILRSLPTLKTIEMQPAKTFWEQFDARQTAAKEFIAQVAALPAAERGQAVANKLKELNPPPHSATIEGLTGEPETVRMRLSPGYHDLSPLMACPQLKKLIISDAGHGLDLTPLAGTAVEDVTCHEEIALRNRMILAKIKTLKTINGRGVRDPLEE